MTLMKKPMAGKPAVAQPRPKRPATPKQPDQPKTLADLTDRELLICQVEQQVETNRLLRNICIALGTEEDFAYKLDKMEALRVGRAARAAASPKG